MQAYNEPAVAIIVGLLMSLSAGVRITLPLLVVSLLAQHKVITLPANFDWLGSDSTVIVLCVACAAETIIHYVPAAGTYLKTAATPLAFVAGTLLMAVPLGGHNPLYQWTLAAFLGGGLATLTHLGVTGSRIATAPANAASLGAFGLVWNTGEFLLSLIFAGLGGIWLVAGWAVGLAALAITAVLIVGGIVLGSVWLMREPRAAESRA